MRPPVLNRHRRVRACYAMTGTDVCDLVPGGEGGGGKPRGGSADRARGAAHTPYPYRPTRSLRAPYALSTRCPVLTAGYAATRCTGTCGMEQGRGGRARRSLGTPLTPPPFSPPEIKQENLPLRYKVSAGSGFSCLISPGAVLGVCDAKRRMLRSERAVAMEMKVPAYALSGTDIAAIACGAARSLALRQRSPLPDAPH
eukprot:2066465-Rhodomonas_salina.2